MKHQRLKDMLAGAAILALLGGLVAPNALAALTSKTIQVFTGVNIYVDDVKLNPQDANGNPVEVFVYNGTTYLPVRAVGEAVGKTVQWDGATSSVYLGKHTGDKPAVWLKDLDCFTGEEFITIDSDKDNLGNIRQNCIIGKSYNFGNSYRFDNSYKINGQYSRITGTLYQQYASRDYASGGGIKIYGDGQLLYEGKMSKGIEPIDFSVDLTGVLELEIIFNAAADWQAHIGVGISNCGLWT